MTIQERGVRVTLSVKDGPDIEGWLWGETPQGLLVAVDKAGKDIRLIRCRAFDSTTYHREDKADFAVQNAEDIADKINDLDEKLDESLRSALANVDHIRLDQIIRQARATSRDIRFSADRRYSESRTSEDMDFRSAKVEEAIRSYERLHDELDRARIFALLERFQTDIANMPQEYTLPEVDLALPEHSSLHDEAAAIPTYWHSRDIERRLREIEQRQLDLTIRSASTGHHVEEAVARPRRDRGRTLRWIGASMRVLSGTTLTAANGLLGLSAGFAGTLASVGAIAVPVAVGVAVSMHTGVTQVLDGMEKIGVLQKEQGEKA
jgi:hypothetical protein